MDETERVQRKRRMERTAEGAVSRRAVMGVISPSAKNSEVVKFKHPVELRNRILDFGPNGEFRYPAHRIRK